MQIEPVATIVPVSIAVGVLLPLQRGEGRGGAERPIEVEKHETKAPAVNLPEALHVIARPIDGSHEHFGSHVVHVLIHIYDVADFAIGVGVVGIL